MQVEDRPQDGCFGYLFLANTNFSTSLPQITPPPPQNQFLLKPTIQIQTVEIGQYETSKHLHTGHYWGYIMALVQPDRNRTSSKYYVPYRAFGNTFYPAYSRGLGYAMSEDLVHVVGRGLADKSITPFPYREDVSVGLYLYAAAKMGRARVRPMQRKDHMPLEIEKFCSEDYLRIANNCPPSKVAHPHPIECELYSVCE